MTVLPAAYADLALIRDPPRLIQEALKTYGTRELAGGANSPTIMAWAAEVGIAREYTADAIPWCGLWTAVVCKRAGWPVVAGPLWALNWSKFGEPGGQPELGDVLTFTRTGGGHVGLYVGEDAGAYHVLGGNTRDDVSIARIDKRRLHACRQPPYRVAKPASSRPIIRSAAGPLSVNEA